MKAALPKGIPGLFYVIFLLSVFQISNAQIAVWTYEPLQGSLNNPMPNIGNGTSAVVNTGGGTIDTQIRTGMTGSGCGAQTSGQSAWALEPFDPGTATDRNGARFSASTVGYQNIVLTWEQRWSNTAPNTVRLQYTVNGTTWTNFPMTAANTTFCNGALNNGRFETDDTGDIYRRVRVDLSAITGVNNIASFGVRLLAAHYRNTGEFRRVNAPGTEASATGTWRFDNVNLSGTPIVGPNPSVMSGTASICTGSSTNIRVQVTGGVSPYTLVYTNGSANFTVNNYTSNANIVVAPTATTTYSIVSVTGANGALGTGNSGNAVITVNPLPTVSATNLSTCLTGAVALTGGFPSGGTYSIANPYSGPSTTFTYTYTNANGCSRTAGPYTFTRNLPIAVSSQPSTAVQSVCQGNAFAPVSVAATGTGLTYQWYSNNTPTTSGGTALTTAAHIGNGSQTNSYLPLSNDVGTLYYYVQLNGSCAPAVRSNVSGAFIVGQAATGGVVNSDQTVCAGTFASDIILSGHTGAIVKWQKAEDVAFSVNVADIVNSNATLASAALGPINQTTYVRAVLGSAVCGEVFSDAAEIAVRFTTWNGTAWSDGLPDATKTMIFEGNYTSGGDVSACACIVNSGSVNFQPEDTMRLLNDLRVVSGNLTFENNASLVQLNDVTNSGSIVYKRDTTPIRKFDYTYWSSPVQNELLLNVSPLTRSDKFFWFDAQLYGWVNADAATTTMESGKGYILRGPNDYSQTMPVVYHANFEGVPNNGEITVPVFVNGANDFNLLGNPYPSAIDADLLMSDPDNAASLGTGTTIYLWTHNTNVTDLQYVFSDYATYNYTGGTGTSPSSGANTSIPNGFIASGQAFFIKGAATGFAKFKNSMRVSGHNDQFFKNASSPKNRFWLEFKNAQGYYKQALIGYMPQATDGVDAGFDALLFDNAVPVNFYSLIGSQKFSIQGKSGNFSDADIVPLGYRAHTPGTFSIDLMQTEGIFESQGIYLEDLQLGLVHDLKASSYSFETSAGTFDGRFRIRYTSSNLGNPTHDIQPADLIVFGGGGSANVKVSGAVISSISLFDVNGKKLVGFENVSAAGIRFPFEVTNQAILVQVITEDGVRLTKKVIF
ncbi:hypothetical protein [Flavobacterium selenitireducens]|uniref:hypothetical protein n=1 Tax=Flavobacterium selenitireducens TaxID=2722704 RepID=UPI00168BFB37|nr:hypothetical protein [Flavobacterium selenitireducens]MBD3581250.1 hypothetical protein [Flavobacterium selenitireducens]